MTKETILDILRDEEIQTEIVNILNQTELKVSIKRGAINIDLTPRKFEIEPVEIDKFIWKDDD